MNTKLYATVGIFTLLAIIVVSVVLSARSKKRKIVKLTNEEAYGGDILKEKLIKDCMDGCEKNCDPKYKCDPSNCVRTCDNVWLNYNAQKDNWYRLTRLGL